MSTRLRAARVLLPLAFALPLLLIGCDGGESGPGTDSGVPPATDSGIGPMSDAGPTTDDSGLPPAPPDCSPTLGGIRDGVPGGPEPVLLIGTRDETGFHAWADGETVPYIWGFQGGTMVMPVLRVEDSGFMDDPLCVHSRIANAFTDEGMPVDVPEFLQDVELHVRDGGYETDPIFDQISYDTPEGRALSMEATISLDMFSVTSSIDVVVGPEGDMPLPGG